MARYDGIGDPMYRLINAIDDIKQRLATLESPTGTQNSSLLNQVQATLANINATASTAAAAWVAANSYTKTQTDTKVASPGNIAPGNVTATGSGTFPSGLSSSGAYGTDVSTLSGPRQQVWQHNSGVYGYAPSSIVKKTNLEPVPFTAADVLAVQPFVFQYKSQLAIRDDPENPYFDPGYVIPWEIGLMAEHLIAHNMGCFVFYEEDGITAKGINYDLFGAIAPLVVLADQEARLRASGI